MSGGSAAVTVLFQLTIGVSLVLLARLSRKHVDRLVPDTFPADERVRRTGVLRRGALACEIVGVLFVLATIPVFLG